MNSFRISYSLPTKPLLIQHHVKPAQTSPLSLLSLLNFFSFSFKSFVFKSSTFYHNFFQTISTISYTRLQTTKPESTSSWQVSILSVCPSSYSFSGLFVFLLLHLNRNFAQIQRKFIEGSQAQQAILCRLTQFLPLTDFLLSLHSFSDRNLLWSPSEVLPSNYNAQQPPSFTGPVEVGVSLFILNFHKLSEADQSFRIDIFLHLKWTDKRLTLPRSWDPNKKLVLGSPLVSQIWMPSLNFKNSRSTSILNSLTPSVYATLSNSSEVFLTTKMTLDVICNMNFANYPFDTQNCSVEIASRKLLFFINIPH